jgi:hypothetical protein
MILIDPQRDGNSSPIAGEGDEFSANARLTRGQSGVHRLLAGYFFFGPGFGAGLGAGLGSGRGSGFAAGAV